MDQHVGYGYGSTTETVVSDLGVTLKLIMDLNKTGTVQWGRKEECVSRCQTGTGAVGRGLEWDISLG